MVIYRKGILIAGLIAVLCLLSSASYGQAANDECFTALHLGSIQAFCSDPDQLHNNTATPSANPRPGCWVDAQHDVWVSFVPTAPAIFIQLIGQQLISDNMIRDPQVALYEGPCSILSIVGCSAMITGPNIAELTINGLTIGQPYYLRIDANNGDIGTYQLCIESFTPVSAPNSDCEEGVILCSKESFFVEHLSGAGNNQSELDASCMMEEFASVWYRWTCDISGTLTFTLTPNNAGVSQITDDLDFTIFELPDGIDDCINKVEVRCMASGANGTVIGGVFVPNPIGQWAGCNGVTGLRSGETDVVEFAGCAPGDDNFVSAVNMVSGESYALIVNNFSQSGFGFSIEFGGTGTFLGPEPDFDIIALEAFECDKTIQFDDLSLAPTDPIVSWQWNFGFGADPVFATGTGPHLVEYESFGEKLIALTVESSRGCLVTKILDIYIEPCCADTSTLFLDAEAADLKCFEIPEGSILAQGGSGSPGYNYSLDGVNFQPSAAFSDLPAGNYSVFVQDIKGCIDEIQIDVDQPPPLIVDAGQDQEVLFGCTVDLNATYTPAIPISITWSPETEYSCDTCLNTTVLPLSSGPFIIDIIDENGCRSTDQIMITVDDQRPYYAPNVFSPNGDGINDFFNIFVGKGATNIDKLFIFDRWGNLIFSGKDIPLNSLNDGWNGRFKDRPVNPGVYAWLVTINYIDNNPQTFSGDITVVR